MKKILLTIISGALCASLMAGCSNEAKTESASSSSVSAESSDSGAESSSSSASSVSESSEDSAAESSSASEEPQYEVITGDFTLDECIVLPEYDGMEITNTVYVAGDDYIDAYIESLNTPEELTDENAEVETGDTVNIDYEGTIDGEVFEGGSAEGFDLKIGSGRFIDGFEDGLIGMKTGGETDLELQFPEDYDHEEYAGKDVVFHVVVNSISRPGEQDDAWVSEYTNGEYSTMDDFRAYTEEMINSSLAENANTTLYDNAWAKVYDGSEFKAVPEDYLTEGEELYMSNVELEAQNYGYSTVEEYFQALGLTEDYIKEFTDSYAESYAKSRVMAEAILEKEGIEPDGEEINAVYNELADGYGMTVDELMEKYGEDRAYLYAVCKVANETVVDKADVTEETEEYNVDM